MSKVTVVGAGNVGATCANVLAFNEVADEVVMLDVKEGVSEGKAMDMMQTAQLLGFDTTVVGCTNDYEKTANSDVVVITSGIPRKPGMTREELIGVNAGIVKSVAQNILKYSPNAILVVISGYPQEPYHRYGRRFGQLSFQILPVSGFGLQCQRSRRYGYRRSR